MPTNYSLIQGVTVNKILKADYDNYVAAGAITQEQIENEVWIFSDDNYLSAINLAKLEALDLTQLYTKTEVNNLLDALSTISIQIVESLPTENISTKTIYLVAKANSESGNIYDEYLYTSNAWEHIGDTTVNLSDYYTKTEVDAKIPTVPTAVTRIWTSSSAE